MEENNQITKKYEFRKLNAKDIPLMIKILTKIKLKRFADVLQSEQIRNALSGKADENLSLVTGGTIILEFAQIILEGIGDCEEIFEMLAQTSNLSRDEIEELDIDVLLEMIIDFIKKDEFVGFMKAVSKLMK